MEFLSFFCPQYSWSKMTVSAAAKKKKRVNVFRHWRRVKKEEEEEETWDDQRQAKQTLPGFSSPWQRDDSASTPKSLKCKQLSLIRTIFSLINI